MFILIGPAWGFQNIPIVLVVFTTLLLVGFFSLVMQLVTADQPSQTRYNMGYKDGFRNAEHHFKHCLGYGCDTKPPSGHTNAYDNGYSKGYHDGWIKARSTDYRSDQQVTQNDTSTISGLPESQVVQNNNSCDVTHEFCAMTNSSG